MGKPADLSVMFGRWCIAALFVAGAVQKSMAPEATQSLLTDAGLSGALVWPALAFNIVGAICLIGGVFLGPVAFALALYCILTSYFHLIPDDPWQMSIFIKNWAIAGGLFVLGGHQSGLRKR